MSDVLLAVVGVLVDWRTVAASLLLVAVGLTAWSWPQLRERAAVAAQWRRERVRVVSFDDVRRVGPAGWERMDRARQDRAKRRASRRALVTARRRRVAAERPLLLSRSSRRLVAR